MSKDSNHRSYGRGKGVESGDPEVHAVEDAPDQSVSVSLALFSPNSSRGKQNGILSKDLRRVNESLHVYIPWV